MIAQVSYTGNMFKYIGKEVFACKGGLIILIISPERNSQTTKRADNVFKVCDERTANALPLMPHVDNQRM